jgi:cell shape-determining protein MreC
MMNIQKTNKSTLKLTIIINLIFLVVGFFYVNKLIYISYSILNIVLLATYFIIEKYGYLFDSMSQTNIIAKNLNKQLGRLEL